MSDVSRSGASEPSILAELLGYLNFSSGAADVQFLRNINEMYRRLEAGGLERADTCQQLRARLAERLDGLAGEQAAFRDAEQARGVLTVVFDHFLPEYRRYHHDLLFDLTDAAHWRPLFLGRVFEVVLRQGGPWGETGRIVTGAIDELDDMIGHRPVAVLHNTQRMEPYEHEWVRPIPLWIREVGAGIGKYRVVIEQALEILRATDPKLLAAAWFDPALLDELAFDPRAYDFDHPVNKRPNYHFGQWDPHHLDLQGRYRRFVVQQVTLDALLERVEHPGELPADELLAEAAAVLAGTILMASGTSGSGPDAHDSTLTLATLLPRIAAYRDAFYKPLIARFPEPHRQRLEAEAVAGRQPFAGARQHLNHALSRRRAAQLEHVHLALLFARLGNPEAAMRQAQVVPVASARILCEIQCRISTGHLAVERGEVALAADLLQEIEDLLHRGIACGALVDPWNVLGFQGQFSLFPSPENSVPDHRIDFFIEVASAVFSLYARVWSEAAARDDAELQSRLSRRLEELATWWDKFGTTTVESVESFSGREAFESAQQVAAALRSWQTGSTSVGDIGFWRKHVQDFNSPKAYALVVARLLEKRDLAAAMALVMQWLSQADHVPLKEGEFSFHRLARRLLEELCRGEFTLRTAEGARPVQPDDRNGLVRRFFDHFEANADDLWQVPRLELESISLKAERHTDEEDDELEEDDEDEPNLFEAAYEQVVFKDSTNDGVEGEMLESGSPPPSDYELERESRRLKDRLALVSTIARLWKIAALAASPAGPLDLSADETLRPWLEQAETNARQLASLLAAVEKRRIPAPSASRESLLEYDRRRSVKESLLESIINTSLETAHAIRFLRAAIPASTPAATGDAGDLGVWRAVLAGEADVVRDRWSDMLAELKAQSVLYVPLSKGGDPALIVAARAVQQTIRDLLRWLPRLGLITETCQLLETARVMEIEHPVGAGAVTEFDRLFEVGYKSLVETLVTVSRDWPAPKSASADDIEAIDSELVEALEQLTESLLRQWLAHSRTLRLSVIEKISDDKAWKTLVGFIETYGHDLFTQRFLNLGNLRAILHQGMDTWLAHVQEESGGEEEELKLLADIDQKMPRAEAIKHLSLVIEAVAENYTEYRDYNTTTTQSDRGEMLYMLLDFLRLRVHYDRVAWNLRPVIMAHEILVRQGRDYAAELWRRAIIERTSEVADTLERRLGELRKKYAMRLPTVSDRLAERFVRPLAIDRARALIAPALESVRRPNQQFAAGRSTACAFELLEEEIEELTQQPTGAGLDVPPWLQALEEEAATAERLAMQGPAADEYQLPLAQTRLSLDDVLRELVEWDKH